MWSLGPTIDEEPTVKDIIVERTLQVIYREAITAHYSTILLCQGSPIGLQLLQESLHERPQNVD